MDDQKKCKLTLFILIMIISFSYGFAFDSYDIQEMNINDTKEYQFIFNITDDKCHHFMSLIDDNGTLNLRPHPGNDVNGWGSSLYLQPFLPGAILKYTEIENISADTSGIYLQAKGKVSYNETERFGTWKINLSFTYDFSVKKVIGIGYYNINIDTLLNQATGDLNLFKIASNYLDDVPLLDPPYFGDTGDMEKVIVSGNSDYPEFIWLPSEMPAHFPFHFTDTLTIDLIGQYNNVNTKAQGYEPIEPAYKPGLKVTLAAIEQSDQMIFGGIYNTDESKKFWLDNVGITPLIHKNSTDTSFQFDIIIESESIEEDSVETSIDDIKNHPDSFQLYQNYPNPFNSTTIIRFEVFYSSKIQIIIYDSRGSMIEQIIDTTMNSGKHQIHYSMNNFPSGIYYCKLSGNGIEKCIKMLYLK